MSGAKHRRKGVAVEREIVELHRAIGVHSERYPLSGSSRFRGSGHDVDIYALGDAGAPLVAEVKARKDGKGFAQLERWLGEYDLLFLRRNRAEPLVVLPWRVWRQLLLELSNGTTASHKGAARGGTAESAQGARASAEGMSNGREAI